jgi:hypothetical protein
VNTYPAQASPAPPAVREGETRASDADRDAAAGLLNEAFAEGRLTADEHDQRLSAAYAARTWEQLRQLIADLPAPPGATQSAAPAMFAAPDLCLLCVLLMIVCPPAGIALWLLSRGHPGTDPGAQLTPARPAVAAAPQPGRPESYR